MGRSAAICLRPRPHRSAWIPRSLQDREKQAGVSERLPLDVCMQQEHSFNPPTKAYLLFFLQVRLCWWALVAGTRRYTPETGGCPPWVAGTADAGWRCSTLSGTWPGSAGQRERGGGGRSPDHSTTTCGNRAAFVRIQGCGRRLLTACLPTPPHPSISPFPKPGG